MRLTLSVVALLGLAVATQTVQAQSPAGTPAEPPVVQMLPATFQPAPAMTYSQPARRGLFGRRTSSPRMTYSQPARMTYPMMPTVTMPMAMPAVGTTTGGTASTGSTTEGTSDVKPASGTTTGTTGGVTTAGFTGSTDATGTILPATYVMTPNGMVMVSGGPTMMPGTSMMMPTEVRTTTTTRRGLFGRRR